VEQLVEIITAVLDELRIMNKKLDTITGNGEKSLDDICSSLANVCVKIDKLNTTTAFRM